MVLKGIWMKKWTTKSGIEVIRLVSGMSNVFAVRKENRFLLVDTGRRMSRRKLLRRIDWMETGGCKLAALIFTHAHYDHTANAKDVLTGHDVPVIINKRDAAYFESGRSAPIKGTVPVIRFLVKQLEQHLMPFVEYPPVKSDIQVDRQMNLVELGFQEVQILHTPGHTLGSQSVIVENEIALVGDAMFGCFPGSIFPPFAQDTELLTESWRHMIDTGCAIFLPSHGTEDTRELVEKEWRKQLKHNKER